MRYDTQFYSVLGTSETNGTGSLVVRTEVSFRDVPTARVTPCSWEARENFSSNVQLVYIYKKSV